MPKEKVNKAKRLENLFLFTKWILIFSEEEDGEGEEEEEGDE